MKKLRLAQIGTRDQMRQLFMEGAPTRAFARGIQMGHVEMYGCFQHIPEIGLPGWVCRAETVSGAQSIYLAIGVDNFTMEYTVKRIEKIPWAEWGGRDTARRISRENRAIPQETRWWTISGGDYPLINRKMADEARRFPLSDSVSKPTVGTRHPSERAGGKSEGLSFWARAMKWMRGER